MIVWLRHFLGWVVGAFRSREDIILENLALRQQLLALHAQRLLLWKKADIRTAAAIPPNLWRFSG